MSDEEFRFLSDSLELIFPSGVNYRTYKDLILSAIGKEVGFLDIYMASEGLMGCQSLSDPDAMELFTDQFFFEFIPYDEYLEGDYKSRNLIAELLCLNPVGIFNPHRSIKDRTAHPHRRFLFKIQNKFQRCLLENLIGKLNVLFYSIF